MFHRFRAIFLFLTIVAVLLVSAVGTTSVYADDGNPPPPPTEAAEVDPPTGEGEAAPTEPAEVEPPAGEGETAPVEPVATEPPVAEPLEEVAPTEAAPVVEEPPLEEVASVVEEPLPAEEVTEVASILEQVPDDTTVTVLNTEGEAQPLTSQESADAILSGDPIWCPLVNGFPTPPGGAGCTQEFPSFAALLTFLDENEADYNQAGAIYVEMGAYAGGESSIDFNAYDFQLIRNNDLVVQGGWNTTTNTTTDSTLFNIPLVIGSSTNPWAGSLTINNISINQVYNQTGLTLFSLGDITLSSVQVTESQNGADLTAGGEVFIENSKFNHNKKFGARIKAGGIVNVLNDGTDPEARTEFNNNGTFGLEIDSLNEVILKRVSAQNNKSFGADINATGFVDVENSIFSGNFYYSGYSHSPSGGYGLKIVTTDSVFMDNVNADENYLFGADVEAVDVEIYESTFNKNGSRSLSNPKGYGLEIDSTGWVLLEGVHADNNQLFGADIEAQQSVDLISSVFSGNKSYKYSGSGTTYHGYGVKVVTPGMIGLDGVTASENNLFGAYLQGADTAIANSDFSNNGSAGKTGSGLEVLSSGAVSLDMVTANTNQLFGAKIEAAGEVAIASSTFSGHKIYIYSCQGKKTLVGGGYGLRVIAGNVVTLDDVKADNNYLYGAYLKGSTVTIAGTLTGSSFSDNGSESLSNPVGKGLEVVSTGAVTLDNVHADNNQFFGADIQAAGLVTVARSFFNGNKSYKYSCNNGTSYHGYGLNVVTTGTGRDGIISLDDVEASGNYLFGAHLQGAATTVKNSDFNNNGSAGITGRGLEVVSSSVVTLDNVHADNNQLFGANVQAADAVTVANSFFSGNHAYTSSSCKGKTYYGYGLQVITTGDVFVDNVTAEKNYLLGAHLKGANVEVTDSGFNLNGTGVMSDHVGKGLEVISADTVTLSGVHADYNQLFGANVQAAGVVTVSNSFFNGNKSYTSTSYSKTYDGYGLKVVTTGEVELNDVTANENYLFGAYLKGAGVEVSNSSFNLNSSPDDKNATGRGLEVVSAGDVLLKYVNANDNQLFGANVQAGGTVTVQSSVFARNIYYTYSSCKGTRSAGYGLKVVAPGAIRLESAPDDLSTSGVQAFENGAEGAILEGGSTVDVVGGQFNDNGTTGLTITASGNVTLTDITASGNEVDGVYVKGVCPNEVRVDNGTFTENDRYGIKIVDAIYSPFGTQTFANNGSGDVFQSGCVTTSTLSATNASTAQMSVASSSGSSYSGGSYRHWNGHSRYHHHYR